MEGQVNVISIFVVDGTMWLRICITHYCYWTVSEFLPCYKVSVIFKAHQQNLTWQTPRTVRTSGSRFFWYSSSLSLLLANCVNFLSYGT